MAPSTTKRKAAAASRRTTTANRFQAAALTPDAPASSGAYAGGILAGAADTGGQRVVQLRVAEISPHPFNAKERSVPQPGNEDWETLLASVKAAGKVQQPATVVSREAFVQHRPDQEDQLADGAQYVLIYGHRRRTAAEEAGLETIPAFVNDPVMADGGDLIEMAMENLGRADLSELAEAELFARFAEDGLTQGQIAEKLGIHQATVSRRLALLLLTPEMQEAINDQVLTANAAAHVAGRLPWGPQRPWQRTKDAEQDTAQRREEQLRVLELVVKNSGFTTQRAVDRVIVERDARAEAAQYGIELITDPRAVMGERYAQYRLYTRPAPDAGTVYGEIADESGALRYYLIPAEPEPGTEPVEDAVEAAEPVPTAPAVSPAAKGATGASGASEAGKKTPATPAPKPAPNPAKEATKARRAAAEQLAQKVVHKALGKDRLLELLLEQVDAGTAGQGSSSAAADLIEQWVGEEPEGVLERVWVKTIAAFEVHASTSTRWSRVDQVYLDLLAERVKYRPTGWEQEQLDEIE